MNISTRRAVRRWLLDAPAGVGYVVVLAAVAVGAVGLYADVPVAVLGGVFGAIGYFVVRDSAEMDLCPTCNSKVSATSERFCSVCGTRLDELPAAPPIDERVPEEYRPVGLEELERSSPAQLAAADGGAPEGTEVLVRGGDSATRDDVADLISEAGIREDAIHTVEQRDDVDGERGGEP